jgi:hypothetical protein
MRITAAIIITEIILENRTECRDLQKKLFELGFKWNNKSHANNQIVWYPLKFPFSIQAWDDNCLTRSLQDEVPVFKNLTGRHSVVFYKDLNIGQDIELAVRITEIKNQIGLTPNKAIRVNNQAEAKIIQK